VKALSFWDPWLSAAILRGGKRVENRVAWTACSYRGPLLLHVAQSHGTIAQFDEAARTILSATGREEPDPAFPFAFRFTYTDPQGAGGWQWRAPLVGPEAVRGAILGRCRLDGVIMNEGDFARYAASVKGAEAQRAWWFGGFALVLADVEIVDRPIPFKAKQGFFEVPDALLAGRTFAAVPS